MKLLFFDDFKLGVLKGDTVMDVSQVVQDIPHTAPHRPAIAQKVVETIMGWFFLNQPVHISKLTRKDAYDKTIEAQIHRWRSGCSNSCPGFRLDSRF